MKNRNERFDEVVRLVRGAMLQLFRRDPIVVQTQDTTIQIEHPNERGSFLTRGWRGRSPRF